MIAAVSILIILAITFFLVRVASVTLKLTGMSEKDARFQALSALTGTGFTTTQSELIVDYPIRRNVISWLMLLGNLGIISIVTTTIISFVGIERDTEAVLKQLCWIVGGTVLFLMIMLNPGVDGTICRLIGRLLEKHTSLGSHLYRRVLHLGGAMSICEHRYANKLDTKIHSVSNNQSDLIILAIRKTTGKIERYFENMTDPIDGDILIIFGSDEHQERLMRLNQSLRKTD